MKARHSTSTRWLARLAPTTLVASIVATGIMWAPPSPQVARPVVLDRIRNLADGLVKPGFARQVVPDIPTQMVGFEWSGRTDGVIEVRVRTDKGWSRWTSVDGETVEGPDKGSREARDKTTAGPVWVGQGVREVAARVAEGELSGLKMHTIRSDSGRGGGGISPAGADVVAPPIITRAQWGANESFRTVAQGCNGQPEYGPGVRHAVVHHTVTSNTYTPEESAAAVRGIYQFHTHTSGFCDIGYNFLVDRFGQVFEGRFGGVDRNVVGAHAQGFNRESTGVAAMGTFTSEPVPAALYAGIRNLLTWKLAVHGVNAQSQVQVGDRGVPAVSGHRDLNATECPGDALYALLPQLRNEVAAGIQASPGRPAVQRGSTFYLRDSQTSGGADGSFVYGNPGDLALFCDWNGDGRRTIGVFRAGRFYLRNGNSAGGADLSFLYGNPGDQPVCGDWNRDGVDSVGVFRGGTWYLRNSNSAGNGDIVIGFGNSGDRALAGDWNGDGFDTPGVVRGPTWYLRNSNSTGPGDIAFNYGNAGDRPVVGDWNADRSSTPGVVRGGTWYLRNSNSGGNGDVTFSYGNATDTPLVWR